MTAKSPAGLFERVRFAGEPLANPKSVVVSGDARFTVLTPRLLRLEWSETGEFEDRGTYAFPTRHAPVPRLTTWVDGDVLVVATDALELRYRRGSGKFTADGLSVAFELGGERRTWAPGMPNPLNLRGTRRTLDMCEGDAALDEGLLSRAGWSLFDDSASVVFDSTGWVAPRPDHDLQDWYFFGYGHDYKGALTEYTRFGGRIPLVPRFVLGAWWSRYWAYSDRDLKELVRDFEKRGLPLDVLVVDMDWHTPDGWTGYTWNRALFPDPPGFLRWVRERGLRTTLNLHPADGVQPHEEIYPRFAEAMGVDPAGGEGIPFRVADKRFVQNYFELLHHPMEDDGVDFWWMDWQQGETSEVKGLDPLSWINHLHFSDSTRRGKRPMLYSRWGGLGNHRYPIGFSGDTFAFWSALQFQPYFTAAASNVCYGWWSHDIGGHQGGATEPELYARWVQFGALSPCLRLHSTKDARAERRPWKYPEEVYRAAKAAFHLRYQLVPYVYTFARVAFDTGISPCRPMYYEYPEEDAAYAARYQYFLGDQIIAAPIVHPADPETGLAAVDVWVPKGTWIDYQTKETFTGPRWVRLVGDLARVPMLVKAGAILPLAPPAENTDTIPKDRLILSVFPGVGGEFRLYEDDGTTETYKEGRGEWTRITTRMRGWDTWVVNLSPVEGRCDVLPGRRRLEIRLEGCNRPQKMLVDGMETADWAYSPEALTATIRVPARDKRQEVTITAVAEGRISALGEAHNHKVILSDVRRLLGNRCPRDVRDFDPVLLLTAPAQSGLLLPLDVVPPLDMMPPADVMPPVVPAPPADALSPAEADAIARLGGPFVRFVEFITPEEASRQLGRAIVGAPASAGDLCDLEATFILFVDGRAVHYNTVQLRDVKGPRVLNAPFAFDGRVQTMRWQAEVRIIWRGQPLLYRYRSASLFPAIHTWRTLIYDRDENPIPLDQVMDAEGHVNEALDWTAFRQSAEGLRKNLREACEVHFVGEYGERLRAGEPLASYITTTIVSPDGREAVLKFQSSGPAAFYLNGREVEVVQESEEVGPSLSFFRPWLPVRRTAVVRLRAGENTLVVNALCAESESPNSSLAWFLSGVFTAPDGDLMTDLAFK